MFPTPGLFEGFLFDFLQFEYDVAGYIFRSLSGLLVSEFIGSVL